jgi:hypothetical protein
MRLPSLAVLAAAGCAGATGEHLITFEAAAAGPADIDRNGPVELDTMNGYHVQLDRAVLHVGAFYLKSSKTISGSQETACIAFDTVYVAQVTTGLDVDLLSSRLQPLPARGEGTTLAAQAGEVWLTGGDVNAQSDPTVILDIAGLATRNGEMFPFVGTFTIGKNWALPAPPNTMPGAHPLCKRRIVTPIFVELALGASGTLVLRADPRQLFDSVDFAGLNKDGDLYRFDDAPKSAASNNLFGALHYAGMYSFAWLPGGP